MRRLKQIFITLAMVFAFVWMTNQGTEVACAAAIPISTAEEFLAIQNNPSGSYYLTKDIKIPANTMIFTDITAYATGFTGTLDGKGHAIKGYTYTGTIVDDTYANVALFGNAKKATFKNLSMTNVNINVNTGNNNGSVAALAARANECNFQNVKITGKINVTSNSNMYGLAIGTISTSICNKVMNCSNSANITVNYKITEFGNIQVTGLTEGASVAKKCTNSGKITVKGGLGDASVYGLFQQAGKITSCKNTGNITLTQNQTGLYDADITIAGIAGKAGYMASCGNTGKIKFTDKIGKITNFYIGGLIAEQDTNYTNYLITKSWNKGKITASNYDSDNSYIAGIAATANKISLCYNKAKITAKAKGGSWEHHVGGLCGTVSDMRNCYNVGAVSLNSAAGGHAGGLAGGAVVWNERVMYNYSTGSVKASKKVSKGLLIGSYSGADIVQKRNIYDNYYRGSGKPYGPSGGITWKDWVAKATKVSSISKGSCSKLSSKYWTYSAKLKRMILKSNKE